MEITKILKLSLLLTCLLFISCNSEDEVSIQTENKENISLERVKRFSL